MFQKIMFTVFSLVVAVWALAAVNINTASEAELTTLSGIGEAKAAAIVQYREDNGDFKTKEDIKKVKGIGDGIFAKIEQEIEVTKAKAKNKQTKKSEKSK